MKKIILCILLSLNITGAKADTIAVDGINRSYILDQTSKAIGPAPLIVALHGSGGSAAQFRRFSNLGNVGNTYGINVVFADGVNHQWNDGRANIGMDANDIGFLTALVNQLVTKGLADPNHVIFTGMSNGGIMSYTMACRSSLRIYAIAPVSANIGEGMTCTNTQARLLNIVGTEDKLVPMAGGNVAGVLQRGTVQSSQASFQAFLNANGCSSKSSVPCQTWPLITCCQSRILELAVREIQWPKLLLRVVATLGRAALPHLSC